MEPFDPTKPNIARVWDYWLGGKDNFAAGLCSRSYVSGLSLADCVFSGRRAGRHAATEGVTLRRT